MLCRPPIQTSCLASLPAEEPCSLERDVFPHWLAGSATQPALRVFGFECPGRFIDIGTPESFAQADEFVRPSAVGE